MTKVLSEMTRTQPGASRRAFEAADSALDVMLTDAADGGPPRTPRPGTAAETRDRPGSPPAADGSSFGRTRRGADERGSRAVGRTAVEARPALRRSGVAVKLAPAAAASDPSGDQRRRRRPDFGRRTGLAPRASGSVRGRQRARCAGPEQLPVVKPGRDQGERRRGGLEPGSGRAELPARLSAAPGHR